MASDNFGSIDQLNASIDRQLFDVAQGLREGILALSGAVLRNLMFKDLLNKEFGSESAELQFWVTSTEAVEPHQSEGPGPYCLSFMVEGHNRYRSRRERLRILTPSTPDFDTYDFDAIASLPTPELIYATRETPDSPPGRRLLGRYMISRSVSFPYREDGIGPQLPSGVVGQEGASDEVRSLSGLLADLKWTTKAQRRMLRTSSSQSVAEDL